MSGRGVLTFRVDQLFFAGCLSLVGLSAATLILLRIPTSFLSRWLDSGIDGAVTLPAPGVRASS